MSNSHEKNNFWRSVVLISLFFMSKHSAYLSFVETNVRNIYLWCPQLIHANYNYFFHQFDQKWIFLTPFFTKPLKWLSLKLLNVIYIYLCNYLIFSHLEKFTNSNDFITIKCYTHYDMIIIYPLKFIFNLIHFEQIMQTLEDIQVNQPESGNSYSFAWSYQSCP